MFDSFVSFYAIPFLALGFLTVPFILLTKPWRMTYYSSPLLFFLAVVFPSALFILLNALSIQEIPSGGGNIEALVYFITYFALAPLVVFLLYSLDKTKDAPPPFPLLDACLYGLFRPVVFLAFVMTFALQVFSPSKSAYKNSVALDARFLVLFLAIGVIGLVTAWRNQGSLAGLFVPPYLQKEPTARILGIGTGVVASVSIVGWFISQFV